MMKVLRLFGLLLIGLSVSAWAEPSANTEVQCDKIREHTDQVKCLESRAQTTQAELAKTEKSYRSALSNAYKVDPNKLTMVVKAFDEVSQEFSAYRTKQCDLMAALAAGDKSAGDRRLSCEIAFNIQRTKILAGELAKLAAPVPPKNKKMTH